MYELFDLAAENQEDADEDENSYPSHMDDTEMLEHLSILRYSGKELMREGKQIGQPFCADNWEYLVDNTLITTHRKGFSKEIDLFYIRAMDDANDEGYVPSIPEIADAIDEYNQVVIQEFYEMCGYDLEEIDIIQGNYIQEFSCLMEDWVETALQNAGRPYFGSSIIREYEIRDQYAPQNILIMEFLR